MNDIGVMQAQLHAYRDFDECVVIGLQWLSWGTSISVDLDFVWQDNGHVRSQEEPRRIVSIRFLGVSEVHVVNDLSDVMANSGTSIRWGIGEIACLRVEKATTPLRSRLTVPSYKASFRREGYGWIEIVFTDWGFTESAQAAGQSPLNLE